MAIPPGLIITAILVVNNLRDLENDRKAGKRTLAVMLGERATRIQYLICMIAGYLVLPLAAGFDVIPWSAMLAWLSLPLAIHAARVVIDKEGRALNAALAGTGQTALLFSLLFWLGLALS
jgi:1,4-dihydroxy-2-naphthoate octaprenyltransferase